MNHAHFHTETEGNSADHVCQVYDTQKGTLWAKPGSEIDSECAAHDRKSGGAADVAE
jgi:hypothetical protein